MSERVEATAHPVDDRAYRAAAALRSTAASRSLPELRIERAHPSIGRAMILAFAVVLVAGLVAIAGRGGSDAGVSNGDADLQWVIGDVPDGFEPSELLTLDASTGGSFDGDVFAVYGTEQAPDGPQFSVTLPDPQTFSQPLDVSEAVNFVERDEGSQRVVFADLAYPVDSQRVATDVRLMFTKIDGRWTRTTSRLISDDDLTAIAAAMTINIDETVAVASEALPDGIDLLGAGTIAQISPIFWSAAGGVPTTAASSLTYQSPSAFEFVRLTVGRTQPADTTVAALGYGGFTASSLDGRPAWFISDADNAAWSALIWQRDGLTFHLTQPGATESALVGLAGTVRRATDTEWQELARTTPGRSAEQPATTDPVEDGPFEPSDTTVDNELPSSVAPANSALDTQPAAGDTVVEIAAENETASQVRLTGTLPGGYAYAVDVSVLADGVRLVPLVSNEPLGTYTPQRPLDESSTFTIVVSGASGSGQGVSGVIATTENPAATQLRVTRITGERYITDLQSIAGQPAVKFSAVLMPKRQLASADLVDADGNILSTWTS